MLKYLSLLCVILFLGCAGQKSVPTPKPDYPWEHLPEEERQMYEVEYDCPAATVRMKTVMGWEVIKVEETGPPDDVMAGQTRTVIDPKDSKKEITLFYVYLPRGLTLAYAYEPDIHLAYIDYYAFLAGVDETKATGEFFCQAKMPEEVEP